jgi:hypothetical protein
MANTYTRMIDGRTETMVEFEPGMFVNTVSASKLGLIRPEQLKAIDTKIEE